MSETPRVSVVMPVWNAMPWLAEAIDSILRQSISDFELVILDDGSTDGSAALLAGYARSDQRIRLFANLANSGPVASSNFVVEQARGEFVARMDADDVAMPHRLERQLAVLAGRPEAVMVGALADTIDARSRRQRPADYRALHRSSAFPPFGHTSIMFRRAAFDAVGGYRAGVERWEDIDLFHRMADQGEVLVVPEVLVSARHTGGSTRFAEGLPALIEALQAMYQQFDKRGGREPRTAVGGEVAYPEAFLSAGSSAVWGGRRPRVLGAMLKTAPLTVSRRGLAVLAWAAAAELSPKTLRLAMRMRLALRNIWWKRRSNETFYCWKRPHFGGK